MTDSPAYVHDCDQCVFLGHVDGEDWYVCPGENFSGVRRRSSHPDGYLSTLRSVWERDKEGMGPTWGALYARWAERTLAADPDYTALRATLENYARAKKGELLSGAVISHRGGAHRMALRVTILGEKGEHLVERVPITEATAAGARRAVLEHARAQRDALDEFLVSEESR